MSRGSKPQSYSCEKVSIYWAYFELRYIKQYASLQFPVWVPNIERCTDLKKKNKVFLLISKRFILSLKTHLFSKMKEYIQYLMLECDLVNIIIHLTYQNHCRMQIYMINFPRFKIIIVVK